MRSGGLWVLRRGSGRFGEWKGDVGDAGERSDVNELQGWLMMIGWDVGRLVWHRE